MKSTTKETAVTTTPTTYRKQIDIHVGETLIASEIVDSAKERFYMLKQTASPAISAHGGLADKVVEAGRVEYRCADGTIIVETIKNA